jgi:quercetin dioxygenase-like cupin family protein
VKIAPGEPGGTPSEQRSSTFTGEVWADPVLSAEGTTIATVFFTPGARTYWHQHERGQILQVLAGHGLICTQGETPEPLRPAVTSAVPILLEELRESLES